MSFNKRRINWARRGLGVLAVGIVAVSIANLTLHDDVRDLWLSAPWGYVLFAIPVACFALLSTMWCVA